MKRLACGALLVALAAVVAAGCGGGGSKTLSKADYGTQLNQICTDYNAKQKEIGDPASLADVAKLGPQILDEFGKAISKGEKLKPPDELKATRDEFIAKSKEQRDLLGQVVDAAKANDSTKAGEIGAKIDPLSKETDALAIQLGAPACAE